MSQTKAQLVSGTTAQDLTVDNINTTSINSGQASGRKNIIINGAMLVAQRGTSSTTSGDFAADRYKPQWFGTDENPTMAQVDVASGTTPYTSGFRKAIKITNGNQTGGAGAGDYVYIRYKVEAQDIANSGWNYVSSSSYITLSFWIKSSVAQNFYGRLETPDGTAQNYPFETGSLSADTWTKITKKIPGNSNLTFDNNNATGIEIFWQIFRGTDFTDNSVSNDTWAAYASGTRTKDATSTWYTTNDSTYEITGVQLEVGSTATDFEHRSFAEELALCQRYFQSITAGFVTGARGASSSMLLYSVTTPVNLRSSPTIAVNNDLGHSNFSTRSYRDGSGTSDSGSTPSANSTYFRSEGNIVHLQQDGFSVTDDRSAVIFYSGGAITMDSEL